MGNIIGVFTQKKSPKGPFRAFCVEQKHELNLNCPFDMTKTMTYRVAHKKKNRTMFFPEKKTAPEPLPPRGRRRND